MPSAKSAKDATEPTPPAEPAAPDPEPAPAPAAGGPGVYEYTHFTDCVYPHVPLTARAATPDRAATVFDWPFGPPTDGRWTPTSKKPNQAPDNEPAPLSSEE
jgi:hypothetical protein